MLRFFTHNLIWTEGRLYLIATALLGGAVYFLYKPLVIIFLILIGFLFYFFRFPKRTPEKGANERSIISPADGKVVSIVYDPQHRLSGSYAYRISIFLSPFDVHVNWTPMDGVVKKVIYKPGKFMLAFLPKSSELNERNDLILTTEFGDIMIRQIAGTVARRICCWVKAGDSLRLGDIFGMIKFSSRVDLFLPATCSVKLKVGDRVYGGQTILGRFKRGH